MKLEAEEPSAPNHSLIESLPIGYTTVKQWPDHLVRTTFEALRLEVRYDKTRHRVTYRVTGTTRHDTATPFNARR
ncbi:hypothetical protein [Nocardia arizonensis]|uniref:hypothetical protein n=1 Tax=Nocardia arizonensis TaxID=1141647 RepID=UPI0006D25B7D|nr:hypothetical protein [Nocardia arizonensis]